MSGRFGRRAERATVALACSIPAVLGGQDTPRVSLHGYLTQGWGRSSGTAFYGMTDDASTDFRYAALQLRYAATPNDQFVVQANHRRLGRSPITDFESDVNLNWAFYQRGFSNGTAVKIGRMPIPRGIYNELRSVGVVLPTYRPPVVFYDEGAYYSETIDGVIASHTFAASSPWRCAPVTCSRRSTTSQVRATCPGSPGALRWRMRTLRDSR